MKEISLSSQDLESLQDYIESGGIVRNLIKKSILDTKGVSAEKLLLYLYEKFYVNVRKEEVANVSDVEQLTNVSYDIILNELRIRGRNDVSKAGSVVFEIPEKVNN